MASVERVLETCIYVSDLDRARRYYEDLFHFAVLFSDARLCAFDAGRSSVLLLFAQGLSEEPVETGGGIIPPHTGVGGGHFAFAIGLQQYEEWRRDLEDRGIAIESEVRWSRGGRSLYFRDPDNNLVELATPGLWATY